MKKVYVNARGDRHLAPEGFSWTILFFGFWVPLLRKDWKWALILFVLSAAVVSFSFPWLADGYHFRIGIPSALVHLYFAFTYNRHYQKELVRQGYFLEE
ncbi:hypothetical protein [Streptococcus ovis]|uniref:hypothetical protein n=1 Tax=Streptococcus ovis TaxID=82806 RepID=UPI000372E38F|nr:hypothetical protein [Streptococcus ovis]